MRRRSSRNAPKATPEKPVEATPRKSRRHSKRRKKSTSESSSEGSDDASLKTVAQQLNVVAPAELPKSHAAAEMEPSAVWTVASTTAAPSGEIRKLKICLRPALNSPEKSEPSSRRHRNKSASQLEDDISSPGDKISRKLRHRGSPMHNAEEPEEQEMEDKKGKGKSKTKHKSKSEKIPQIQDDQDQTQCEISENIQVTSQSPPAAIDIRVDNESVSSIIECETVGGQQSEISNVCEPTNSNNVCDLTEDLANKQNKCVVESQEDSMETNSQDDENSQNAEVVQEIVVANEEEIQDVVQIKNNKESAEVVIEEGSECVQDVAAEEQLETVIVEEINKQEDSTEYPMQIEIASEICIVEEHPEVEVPSETECLQTMEVDDGWVMVISENKTEEESTVPKPHEDEVEKNVDESESVQKQHSPSPPDEEKLSSVETEHIQHEPKAAEHPKEQASPHIEPEDHGSNAMQVEESHSDEDSRSVDAINIDSNSTPHEASCKEDSFNLTQSFSPDVREIVEENKKLQSMKDEIRELFPTPVKVDRKRRWGNALVSLEVLEPFLYKIDCTTVQKFCPDVKLLEEAELKLDIQEEKAEKRKSVSQHKERRSERKVSVEYKPKEVERKRLDTESSNISEMEEITEPEVDNSNIIAMNRKISIVEDTASKLKPPPSPSRNPASEILFITNLVRPFTLKQLKELLERTGKITENGFWTDRIKSKCYVSYETVEEAEATRNALHGVHWPIGNGKKLMIDFATAVDLENARNPAPPPVVEKESNPEKENQATVNRQKSEERERPVKDPEKPRNEPHVREWDVGKEDMKRLRSRSRERERHNERNERRKHRRTPTPHEDFISRKQRKKEEEIPQKLMDDLFRKTKTTPSIYWLPLTPEEISTKQQQRLLRMAEHKRRMEESSRNRGDYGRGAPFRRRYD